MCYINTFIGKYNSIHNIAIRLEQMGRSCDLNIMVTVIGRYA